MCTHRRNAIHRQRENETLSLGIFILMRWVIRSNHDADIVRLFVEKPTEAMIPSEQQLAQLTDFVSFLENWSKCSKVRFSKRTATAVWDGALRGRDAEHVANRFLFNFRYLAAAESTVHSVCKISKVIRRHRRSLKSFLAIQEDFNSVGVICQTHARASKRLRTASWRDAWQCRTNTAYWCVLHFLWSI